MSRLSVLLGAGAVLIVAMGWFATAEQGGPVPRSEHSRPAFATPPAVVAVTPDGKLYHRPDCTYIHGPAHLESGGEALANGYTPCTRCLKQ